MATLRHRIPLAKQILTRSIAIPTAFKPRSFSRQASSQFNTAEQELQASEFQNKLTYLSNPLTKVGLGEDEHRAQYSAFMHNIFETLTKSGRRGVSPARVKPLERVFVAFSQEYTPDVKECTKVMTAYARSGQASKALALFKKMTSASIEPNVVTFTVLFESLCRGGDINGAKHVFRQMLAANIEPDEKTYAVLIHGACDVGDMEFGFELYEAMLRADYTPNAYLLSNIVRGFTNAQVYDKAIEYYQILKKYNELEKNKNHAAKPITPQTYHSVMQAYLKQDNIEGVFDIHKEMVAAEVTPDKQGYATLMTACVRMQMPEKALEFYDCMAGHDRDAVIVNIQVRVLCRMGRIHEAMVSLNRVKSFYPNELPDAYQHVMTALAQGGGDSTPVAHQQIEHARSVQRSREEYRKRLMDQGLWVERPFVKQRVAKQIFTSYLASLKQLVVNFGCLGVQRALEFLDHAHKMHAVQEGATEGFVGGVDEILLAELGSGELYAALFSVFHTKSVEAHKKSNRQTITTIDSILEHYARHKPARHSDGIVQAAHIKALLNNHCFETALTRVCQPEHMTNESCGAVLNSCMTAHRRTGRPQFVGQAAELTQIMRDAGLEPEKQVTDFLAEHGRGESHM